MRLLRLTSQLLLVLVLTAGYASDAARAQPIPIADARSQGEGATVTVEGIVTRALGDFVRIQDGSGDVGASGLTIRQTDGAFSEAVQDGTIAPGDVLQVTGTLSSFNGLLQVNDGDLDDYVITGTSSVPAPLDVTIADVTTDGEAYESVLVRLPNLSLSGAVGTFAADATYGAISADTGTRIDLRVQGSDESAVAGTAAPDGAFTYTGIVGQFDPGGARAGYQLLPIRTGDLSADPSLLFASSFTIGAETSGSATITVRAVNVPSTTTVEATVDVVGGSATEGSDVSGVPNAVSITGSGATSFTVTLDDDGASEGVEDLRLQLSAPQNAALAVPRDHALWILDAPGATTTVLDGQTGSSLLDNLEAQFGGATTLGYDVARDTLYDTVYNDGGTVTGFYTGYGVPRGTGDASQAVGDGGINTEHTYPQSRGAGMEPARSDLHILVPTRGAVNSARSNYPYGEIPDAQTDRWFVEDEVTRTAPAADVRDRYSEVDDSPSIRAERRFEPRERVKGDVARKVLYFRVAYPSKVDADFFQDQLATLLRWNEADPPDADEVRRNAIAATYQDRLNPFVLDPSLALRAFAPDGVAVPETFGVSAQKAFGSIADGAEYELVALPGREARPLAQTLAGDPGQDWKAFWDDGSDEDFLIDYAPTEQFEFQPGRGFWLISRTDWTVNTRVASVPLQDGTADVPLHDGWNILSNPFDLDVAWADVSAANGGGLQTLWRWEDGQFREASTLATAASGEAYYFLNDGGLDALTLPYPTLDVTKATPAPDGPSLTLTAVRDNARDGATVATAGVQFVEGAREGRDARDQVAPPAAFAPVRLVIDAPGPSVPPRQRALARDARPPLASTDGQTMRLRLTSTTDAPLRLEATTDGLEGQNVVLVDSASGERIDLRREDAVLDSGADAWTFTLVVGSDRYVADQKAASLPDDVALQSIYPNPVRGTATFRYTLPEAADVRLDLFDLLGRRVATVVNGRRPAGRHDARWAVEGVSSGVYLARFRAAGRSFVRKVVVVR